MERIKAERLNAVLRKVFHKSRYLQMTHYHGNGDLRLLGMLARHFKEATPSQLAEKLEIALPTVSQKLSALEEQGLISRKADPNDRRKTIVFATPKGEELLKADYGRFIDSFSSACKKLGEEKVAALTRLVEELDDYIDREIHRGDDNEIY